MLSSFIHTLNSWGHRRIPFLFVIDFEMEKPMAWKMSEIDPNEILFSVNGHTNQSDVQRNVDTAVADSLRKFPLPFDDYRHKFDTVSKHLLYGDSFLTNLT